MINIRVHNFLFILKFDLSSVVPPVFLGTIQSFIPRSRCRENVKVVVSEESHGSCMLFREFLKFGSNFKTYLESV